MCLSLCYYLSFSRLPNSHKYIQIKNIVIVTSIDNCGRCYFRAEKGETDSKSLYSSRKLTSENVTHDDLHSYTCVIQNVYGKASITFILKGGSLPVANCA